jgi:hypothetical protein
MLACKPNARERLSHGEPAWFIRGKRVFVTFADRHRDGRVVFWCAAPEGAQQVIVAAAPSRFFVPPYVVCRGWLGVYLDVPVTWDEIATVVEHSDRAVAPARLIAGLKSETDRPVSDL